MSAGSGPARDTLLRGLASLERGDADTAHKIWEAAGALRFEDAGTAQAWGLLAARLGHAAASRPRLRREAQRFPRDAQLRLLLGLAYRAEGAWGPAAGAFRQALRLRPGWSDAVYNLAIVLDEQDQPDASVRLLTETLKRHPTDPDLWNQLGQSLDAAGRHDEALDAQQRAHGLLPDDAGFALNLGLSLLQAGRFDEGWPLFDRRLQLARGLRPPTTEAAVWRGEPLDGKTLLLWSEQGLGDAIFTLRWLETLRQRGASVVLRLPPSLHDLYRDAPAVHAVVGFEEPLPPVDFQLPLMSLPGKLGVGVDRPLATPDGGASLRELDAIAPASLPDGAHRRVGLIWAGNPAHANDRRRSIPPRAFRPLLEREDVAFVSLQYGAAAGTLKHRRLTQPPQEELADFRATAGWMRALDGIVTVDTAAAHLAGSLGVTTWLLLSTAADWRWGRGGETTPWYSSVRIFRQCTPGDWRAVLRQVGDALESSPA